MSQRSHCGTKDTLEVRKYPKQEQRYQWQQPKGNENEMG